MSAAGLQNLSYTYDQNGHMSVRDTSGQVFNLAYDAESRLISVQAAGVQILPTTTPTDKYLMRNAKAMGKH